MARVIRNFEIIQEIGKGGMAVIFKAKQSSLDRLVAIKELYPNLAKDEDVIRRFETEAKAIAKLQHENLINIIDYGKEGESYFIAMEFVDGLTLKDLLAKAKKIPAALTVRIAMEVCKGLEYAHEKGIFHRDIKPANIMLSRDGAVKIADFGIAKNLESTGETKTGQAVGTPAYMSPEQLAGRKVDARTDLFSLGVMIYEMLGGVRPFPGDTLHTIITQIIQTTPRPIMELDPLVPPELSKIVTRSLEKDMDKRYSSAGEILKDLQEFVQKENISISKKDVAAFVGDPAGYALKQKERDISEFLDRGTYYMNLGIGRIDDAIAELKKVLVLDPTHSQAKELMAKLAQEKAKAPAPKAAAKPAAKPAAAAKAPRAAAAEQRAPGAGIGRIAMIAGGAVALIAIGVGSYFLLQGSSPPPSKIEPPRAAAPAAPAVPSTQASIAFLSVNTTPGGATVFLDGKPSMERTPTVISNVMSGEHLVSIKKDGYIDQEQKVTLAPGGSQKIDVILQQVPRTNAARTEAPKREAPAPAAKAPRAAAVEPGFLKVSVTPWAEVSVDGQGVGTTPIAEPIKLSPGQHTLSLKNPNFPEYTEAVTIASNRTTEKTVTLKPGAPAYFKVNVTPWADVFIDGQKVGTTPMADAVKVSPGTHTVLLSNPGCEEWFEDIEFKPGETVRKTLTLKKK